MNAIPLINNIPKTNINNEKQLRQEINTSLVALKKEAGTLEGLINEAAQMLVTINNRIATLENDTVKKSDIVDVVQSGNLQPVTSNAVSGAISTKQERYYFTRGGVSGKRYVLLGTADGSTTELANMSCDITTINRDIVNNTSNFARFGIHLDINFQNQQSNLEVKGWTDINLASSNTLSVAIVITKSGTTSYIYLDCTDPWFIGFIIPITQTLTGKFSYQLPPTEVTSLTGDIVYNSRTDPTKIAQVCWNEMNINYTATSISTSVTKIMTNVPEFNEAIITTSNDTLYLKRDLDNNISLASSYMKYTLSGEWDMAYDLRVEWSTHEMQFRQTVKGANSNFVTIRKMFYR